MVSALILLVGALTCLAGGVGIILNVRRRRRLVRGQFIVLPHEELGSIAGGVYLIVSGLAILIIVFSYWPAA